MRNKSIVENAVMNISVCLSKDKINKKDLHRMKNEILLIEIHMHDLVHLYDLLNMREKSKYYHPEDKLVTVEEVTQ